MSYFDDASLVMIPSGYKTSKVYSVKPTDGSGDLTFSRSNDTATRVNSAGLIEKVRTNLATYSSDFSQAYSLLNATISTNTTTDPFGTSLADSHLETATTSIHAGYSDYTVTSGAEVSYSIYAKSIGGRNIQIIGSTGFTGPVAIVNLSNGTLLSGSTADAKVTSAGNGWYRISITETTTTTTARILIYSLDGTSTTFAGDVTKGVYLFGRQLEYGVATSYIPTTTAAVSVGPIANVPRLDYLNSSCPRLLLEPQRTNVITFSEQIDNAAWIKGNSPTITTNIATAPDGTTSADGIQDTTGGTYKTIAQNISLSANSTLTLSFFVKKETSETAFGGFTMYFQGGTDKIVYGIVNAVTGAVTYASSTLTPTTKVEDYGTYWRIASTATDNGSNTLCSIGYYGTLSANGTALSPAIGSVRTVWGFQAEVGAYATSYIPTLGSASTRAADAASKTGISSLIGQTEGTLFIDVNLDTRQHFTYFVIAPDATSAANYLGFYISNAIIGLESVVGSAVQAAINLSNSATGRFKIAAAYKENDFVLYVNGTQVGTDTSGSVPACSQVGLYQYNQTQPLKYNQALLFKTRLTNAQLAELTTL